MFDFLVGPWNLFIVQPLINALVLLYLPLRDFGVAIVALTVLIRLATYPLFVAQLRSQRAMQELQPAIAELRKKYKDDRQKMAQEQMRLYKERGSNPAAGCLPLLIQLPILIGLYSALIQVGCGLGRMFGECPGLTGPELERVLYTFVPNPGAIDTSAHWLPWITGGLSQPEPFPWKILAILAGVTQFVASLMALPAKTPKTDDPTQRSMQLMVYYFPLITIWFAWSFPSGLAVYWVTTTLFQIVQQYFVSGWGKLGALVPAIGRLPSPGEQTKREEQRQIVEEVRGEAKYPGASDGEVGQRKADGERSTRKKRRKRGRR
jgi:YidC/Oxa1 family membrane protein insertase